MIMELLVFATMFTLIVLLTGGPSNRLYSILWTSLLRISPHNLNG